MAANQTARTRAMMVAKAAGLTPSNPAYLAVVDATEIAFNEHAREQRESCAEVARLRVEDWGAALAMKNAVLDAPEPGR